MENRFKLIISNCFFYRIVVCNMLVIIVVLHSFSGTINGESDQPVIRTPTSYCGINCLYAISKFKGKKVLLEDLIDPNYITSREGSSLSDLKQAATDIGLFAEYTRNMSLEVLQKCEDTVILHVKTNAKKKNYSHYILFLGTKNGKAKIFDPPNPVELISFAELAPRWDSYGLIVSNEPIDLGAIFAPARKRFILYAVIAISIILSLHWAKRFLPVGLFNSRIKFMGMSVAQAAGFAVAAMLIGMFYHFANDAGFLARANATASIQEAHEGNFIPKINEKQVKELLNTDTVFIDARLSSDFKAEHLEGAISVPVDSNDVERHEATAGIEKDARIVMYCQSSGCQYAEIVAIKLKEDGFTNISIYKGGWADWKQKNSKNKEVS